MLLSCIAEQNSFAPYRVLDITISLSSGSTKYEWTKYVKEPLDSPSRRVPCHDFNKYSSEGSIRFHPTCGTLTSSDVPRPVLSLVTLPLMISKPECRPNS